MDVGDETRAIALNISKAFDKAWHAGLLHKLKEYGCPLGSTLFLVYINDLPDGALSRIGIYADDTTAYSGIQTSDFFDRLQMTSEMEKDLHLLSGMKSSWHHSMLPRPNFCLNCPGESIFISLKINDTE